MPQRLGRNKRWHTEVSSQHIGGMSREYPWYRTTPGHDPVGTHVRTLTTKRDVTEALHTRCRAAVSKRRITPDPKSRESLLKFLNPFSVTRFGHLFVALGGWQRCRPWCMDKLTHMTALGTVSFQAFQQPLTHSSIPRSQKPLIKLTS